MKVLLFLIGLFSLAIFSSFPKPTPRLELLDSTPPDSVFRYELNDEELKEIDLICGRLNRSMKERFEFVFFAKWKIQNEIKITSPSRGTVL
ncbi:MAG TPA: hypothetical protein VNL73_06835 [Verrucomicrobiae bacterium]|nr:hypothetical protein [Verrucomicrobiae bacterium]